MVYEVRTGQSAGCGCGKGQKGPRRRPRPVGSPSNAGSPVTTTPTTLRVFDTLWLKAGFALHAYEYRGRQQRQRHHLGGAG